MSQKRPKRLCQLRTLLDQIVHLDEEEEVSSINSEAPAIVLQKLREINEQDQGTSSAIKHIDETFLDLKIYNAASNVTYKGVTAVDYSQNTFDLGEFLNKIKANCNPIAELENNLSGILSEYEQAIYGSKSFVPFHGALDETLEVPKKPRERREAASQKATKKELIKVVDDKEDRSIDDEPKYIYKVLMDYFEKLQKPVGYYSFLIDTTSFSQTVENMFYASFLINEGKVALIVDDEDNELKLKPLPKSAPTKAASTLEKNQLVLDLTMSFWQTFSEEGILQQYRSKV